MPRVNCACVIHGDKYEWTYVEKLYSMLCRNISRPIRLHVWTEASRPVPKPFVKHVLTEWPGIEGPRKSWWYKMQMFDPAHVPGRLIYFDLDVVIIENIDWMVNLDPQYFWALRDFKHLFRGAWSGINSSCMIWQTGRFKYIWQEFCRNDIQKLARTFPGDQDFLTSVIDNKKLRYLDDNRVKSWRWEIKDGGMNFKTRSYHRPGAGSVVPLNTSIMVFHGNPKPHEVQDPIVQQNWC